MSQAFDAIVDDVKDRVARDKHLRVERLVKLQAKPCGICEKPIVWAVASSSSGKRLPFDTSQLLNNSLKVVVAADETLEVWPFAPPKHRCKAEWLPSHAHVGISEGGPRQIHHKHGGPRDHDHVHLGWGDAIYEEETA